MLIARKNGSLIKSCTSPDGSATAVAAPSPALLRGNSIGSPRSTHKGEIKRGLGRNRNGAGRKSAGRQDFGLPAQSLLDTFRFHGGLHRFVQVRGRSLVAEALFELLREIGSELFQILHAFGSFR
jgi:hypothetical protein